MSGEQSANLPPFPIFFMYPSNVALLLAEVDLGRSPKEARGERKGRPHSEGQVHRSGPRHSGSREGWGCGIPLLEIPCV